jgi:probable addiction module antidote protein
MKISKRLKTTGKTIRSKPAPNSEGYESFLFEKLKDIDFSAGYLTACLEEGEDVFLLGIRNVALAQGGMKALSRATKLNRENLYDMLSEKGNPRLTSITKVLDSFGFKVSIVKKVVGSRAA